MATHLSLSYKFLQVKITLRFPAFDVLLLSYIDNPSSKDGLPFKTVIFLISYMKGSYTRPWNLS